MKVADLLVKAKADLNVQDNRGFFPIEWVRRDNAEAFGDMLAKNGKKADGNYIEDDTEALVNAAYEGFNSIE